MRVGIARCPGDWIDREVAPLYSDNGRPGIETAHLRPIRRRRMSGSLPVLARKGMSCGFGSFLVSVSLAVVTASRDLRITVAFKLT